MPNAILFVIDLHTSAMHGSMVPYIGHAAMRLGRSPNLGPSFYQRDSVWFSGVEQALAYL
jgi:hypothetical protein